MVWYNAPVAELMYVIEIKCPFSCKEEKQFSERAGDRSFFWKRIQVVVLY